MFTENIRFQIAAILILAVIVITYSRSKKLPLVSTKWFSVLLAAACANLVFDVSSVYTITHIDTVGATANRICHQLFIGSLNIVIMCLYFYISYLGKQEERRSLLSLLLRLTPIILSIIEVICGNLYYVVNSNGAYSYGPMADTVYACCAIYVIGAIIDTIKYRTIIGKERAVSVYVGISVWVLAVVIQFFAKTLLISGLSLSLFIVIIYLSFENPREYLNETSKTFNSVAYTKMLKQAFGRKRTFYVINLSINEYDTIRRMSGQATAHEMLGVITQYIQSEYDIRIYNPSGNHLIAIIDSAGQTNQTLLNRISRIQERFQYTWNFGYSTYHLEPSITIVECPRYAKDEKELHEVLHYMVAQKQVGSVGIRTVNQYIIEQQKRVNHIADLVHQAIENDGIEMLYQPIYSVKEQGFASAEALVRLNNTGDMGFISPEEFIPIAEEKGYIMALGERIFEKVCAFVNDNGLESLGVHYIEVNLSAIQCIDSDLPRQLRGIMKKYHIEPAFINLEITETAAIESGELLAKNMKKLKDMGCSFSMDDFGTGYSNLSKMVEVRYDLIKLDKSLIWPCFEENGDKAKVILDNVINMVTHLDIKIVAEGVETEEQVERLKELNVDYLQGYYYSRPVHGDEYLTFLKNHSKEA